MFNKINKYTICLTITILSTIVCSSQTDQYIATGEHKAMFKGNEFAYQQLGKKDTAYLIDPVTERIVSKVIDVYQVVAMNGHKIYEMTEVAPPPLVDNISTQLEEYLLKNLIKEPWLLKWEGLMRVELWDIVIDENGKFVYWAEGGIAYMQKDKTTRRLNSTDKLELWFTGYPIKPFTLNGTNVPVRLNASLLRYTIVIKNHAVTYTRGNLFAPIP